MGIKQIQTTRAIEKIVKYYLLEGKYPTMQTITHHFSQWLRDHTPGAPGFKATKIARRQKSDAKQYNNDVNLIYQDISDAYEATIDQTTRIISDFEFAETERNKLWYSLSQISKKIDQLFLVAKNGSGYLDTIIETFTDMSNINKTDTTAYVDLQRQQVSLKENLRKSSKILMNGATAKFKTLTTNITHAALESMTNAFDDNMNTAWWHVVKTEAPGTMRAELEILFPREEEINEISYVAHHVNPVFIQAEYTQDGLTFSPIPGLNNKQKVVDTAVWSFSKMKVRGIKFTYEKKEHDDYSGGVYQYYFGAKNISVANKNYVAEGVLYTNPIEFNSSNINIVSIIADHQIPSGTSIDYEIAQYESGKPVDQLLWFPISSSDETTPKYSKVVEFQAKKLRYVEMNKAEPTLEVKNGMQVFRLLQDDGNGVLPHTFEDISKPILLRGINQWRRERTYLAFDGSMPLNSAWQDQYENRPQSIRIDYLPIGNTLSLSREGGGSTDNFFRFTTCIYSDETKVSPLSLSVLKTQANGPKRRIATYSVYLNQKRLVPSNEEVTLTLQPGWNEIQILYHFGDTQLRKDLAESEMPAETLLGKFNFAAQAKVRADREPLRYVDTHTLYYNISPNNRDCFSIYEQQVVLNYLPKSCIFQLSYEIHDTSVQNNRIVLRATLKRNEDVPHLSPKINKIELRAR